jgi:hypothetical protein
MITGAMAAVTVNPTIFIQTILSKDLVGSMSYYDFLKIEENVVKEMLIEGAEIEINNRAKFTTRI